MPAIKADLLLVVLERHLAFDELRSVWLLAGLFSSVYARPMVGIRLILGSKRIKVPPGFQSVFSYLFQPLADELRPLYWYADRYESSPFNNMASEPGQENWYEEATIPLPQQRERGYTQSGILFRPGTLPDAARHLFTEWMDVIGIAGDESHAIATASKLYTAEDRARSAEFVEWLSEVEEFWHGVIEQHAKLHFHCMDGKWWEMYSPKEDDVQRVIDHVSRNDTVRIERTSLKEKIELWLPPGEPKKAFVVANEVQATDALCRSACDTRHGNS